MFGGSLGGRLRILWGVSLVDGDGWGVEVGMEMARVWNLGMDVGMDGGDMYCDGWKGCPF